MPHGSSTTHRGDAHMEEGCTSGVWLENESIFIELPKVSEVVTNYWVFSKVWLVTYLYFILLPIQG